jgi:hypothetical protein
MNGIGDGCEYPEGTATNTGGTCVAPSLTLLKEEELCLF